MKSLSIEERPLFFGGLRPSKIPLTLERWGKVQANNPGFVIPRPGEERDWVKAEYIRRSDDPSYPDSEKNTSYLTLEYRRRKAEGTL